MIFIDNKYTKWYYSLIEKAKNRKLDLYVERHHIIPRSLGGDNAINNIVEVTPREHYICHLLLTKMTYGKDKYKMAFALSMMMNIQNIGKGRYKASSRYYDYSRKLFTEAMKDYWSEDRRSMQAKYTSAYRKGKLLSEEHKQKLRNKIWSQKALDSRLDNCLKAAANRAGKPWSEKRRASYVSKPLSDAHKKKISLSSKGKPKSLKEIETRRLHTKEKIRKYQELPSKCIVCDTILPYLKRKKKCCSQKCSGLMHKGKLRSKTKLESII